ncbi:MAG: 4-hydroxythreonine-4-phosphate dehydrogenase PdxA [Bacteroides sp.]|nr:4-hydroxythreonine-4-phosphate dehydrogenase PdxA [Bacteroides sp.]MBD5343160.1 4-hydroxythreonine-4-phosphate dehydrogenase PdxA [Bacteroides sp.]MBD5364474.1 4-hydroxythreonine-4-phosphate dehydrogenase PdxA [Bacteroides sp.]MBD5372423.1 4-hydroxythreonine-4-phosphate dehydrogenase PdxA [Bacteroides sp.]
MEDKKIIVGITHGDINGVGYEVILKSFEDPQMFDLCVPVVYGSLKIASAYRKQLGLPQIPYQIIDSAANAKPGVLNFINVVGEDVVAEPGKSTEAAGAAALAALERATADLLGSEIDCLVTAPINKANIQGDNFHFAGHTEYLQARLGADDDRALMIMASDRGLRVALVTTHLPLKDISPALTKELITQKIKDFNSALVSDFAVHAPRIAVLALNPHNGDGGLLGKEEEEIIIPAIEAARDEKILVYGPYPADGFFGAGHQSKFDGVLAMYHDQGLTPFKALSGTDGVNFTAGLPYVRTSPDHGTAYDIAGRGEADPQSMRSAIYMAIDALRARRNHHSSVSNPLPKLYQERPGRD